MYTRDVMISKSYDMILRYEVHDTIFIVIFKRKKKRKINNWEKMKMLYILKLNYSSAL